MTVEEQLVDLLMANSSITSLIDDRVFPVAITKQTVFPALTYERVSGKYEYSLEGHSVWCTVSVQLTSWSDNYPDARKLAEICRSIFNPFVGETVGGIEVAGVEDGRDVWVQAAQVLWGCPIIVIASFSQE